MQSESCLFLSVSSCFFFLPTRRRDTLTLCSGHVNMTTVTKKKKEIKESRRKSLLLCTKLFCFSSEILHVHLPLLSLRVSDCYTVPKECAFGKTGHDCEYTELNASSYSQILQWYRKFLFSVLALSDT